MRDTRPEERRLCSPTNENESSYVTAPDRFKDVSSIFAIYIAARSIFAHNEPTNQAKSPSVMLSSQWGGDYNIPRFILCCNNSRALCPGTPNPGRTCPNQLRKMKRARGRTWSVVIPHTAVQVSLIPPRVYRQLCGLVANRNIFTVWTTLYSNTISSR